MSACVVCGAGINHDPKHCDACVFEYGTEAERSAVWARATGEAPPPVKVEPVPDAAWESVWAGYDEAVANGNAVIAEALDLDKQRAVVAPPAGLDVEGVFGPGGPLHKPGFEVRPGQVRLSRAIYDALAEGHHLLAEGPCGIGKSKAYGVPAAYLASQGKRVLIVTASIALQDQLVRKDLPELAADLSHLAFRFEVMKGRSNYLCKWQHEEESDAGLTPDERAEYRKIEAWARTTPDGDRTRLPIIPSANVWRRFSVSTEECLGKHCDFYDDCHAYEAKRRAAEAGIVVTNYHMLMLDLQMGGVVLPPADAIILDEAHEAAGIARNFLGWTLTANQFRRIAKECEKRGHSKLGAQLREEIDAFFGKLITFARSEYYASFLRATLPIRTAPLVDLLREFREAMPTSKLVDRSNVLALGLLRSCNADEDAYVTSIEVEERKGVSSAKIVTRLVEPGEQLRELLWDARPAVAAVSATVTTDQNFTFVRREIGAPDEARELIVESPFDFEANSRTVVFERMPDTSAPNYAHEAARVVERVAQQARGRTMALFTSYKSVRTVAEYLRAAGEFVVLVQGEAPVATIVDAFKRATTPAVLLGTSSLWTGVDVQGPALSAVVIDRIPFTSPDDPVAKRIQQALGSKAFSTFQVPAAILQFRQGSGRLIRSQRDRGVLVLLDPRFTKKGYGGRFLRSIPSAPRVKLNGIKDFLDGNGES